MRTLNVGEDTSEIDKGVRNPWKWFWLDECSQNGCKFETWCKKIDQPGKCFCSVCSKTISYGSAGKKALKTHDQQGDHVTRLKSVQTSSKLISESGSSGHTKQSIQDGSSEVKSIVSLFISQHCLPFSMAPELLALAQRLSKNPIALKSTNLSHTSATYNTTHGVAAFVKSELSLKLKESFFSLNIDEATTKAGNKILNILVQYYDNEVGRFLVDLLGSREVNVANSDNLLWAVNDVLQERGLKWSQVISVLMDNCSVMRGVREGLEPKMRKQNECLLDISGDTVHMMNNAAKKLLGEVEKDFFSVSALASDLFYDIEDSPKVRSLFFEIQQILYGKKLSLIRPIPTRFLQMKTVVDRLDRLWDSLRLYYSAFLSSKEKQAKLLVQEEIFEKFSVTESDRKVIQNILINQHKQKKSDANSDRKERIINGIYDNKSKVFFAIQLFRGILQIFQGFTLKFQSNKPLGHSVHVELFNLAKSFYSCFISPDTIAECTARSLNKLDLEDRNIQVKDRHLCVGEYCLPLLLKCLRDKSSNPWLSSFFKCLRQGYRPIEAGRLMKKLPLDNQVFIRLSCLDPCNQRSSSTVGALLSMAEKLPNVISCSEIGQLDIELRKYTIDDDVTSLDADSDDADFRIDTKWWVPIFNLKQEGAVRYPILSKFVKALLSVFTGPLVEGSFNTMDDIIEDDRSRMTTYNYEALAMTKAYMSSRGLNSTTMTIPVKMIKCVSRSWDTYKTYLEKKAIAVAMTATCTSQSSIAKSFPAATTITTQASSANKSISATATPTTTKASTIKSIPATTTTATTSTSTQASPCMKSIHATAPLPPPVSLLLSITTNIQQSSSIPVVTATTATTTTTQPSSYPNPVGLLATKRKQSSLAGFFSKKPRT